MAISTLAKTDPQLHSDTSIACAQLTFLQTARGDVNSFLSEVGAEGFVVSETQGLPLSRQGQRDEIDLHVGIEVKN